MTRICVLALIVAAISACASVPPRAQSQVSKSLVGLLSEWPTPAESLRRVSRDTTQWLVWDSPVYAQLLSTVRDMNAFRILDTRGAIT